MRNCNMFISRSPKRLRAYHKSDCSISKAASNRFWPALQQNVMVNPMSLQSVKKLVYLRSIISKAVPVPGLPVKLSARVVQFLTAQGYLCQNSLEDSVR